MANKEGKNKLTRECAGITGTIKKKKNYKESKKKKEKETNSFLHTVATTQVKQATLWGSASQVTTAFARALIILR